MASEAPRPAAFHDGNCVICRRVDDLHRISEVGKAVCARCAPVLLRQKIESTVRRYRMIRKREAVAVALSGGKDSGALLHALQHLRGRLSFSLIALHVHMGLGEYSDRSLEACRRQASALGVPLRVAQAEEYGVRVEGTKQWPGCAVCGTVRRTILGRWCRDLGVDSYCTGHTLDDQLQFMLKRLLSGRHDAPHPVGHDIPSYPRKCRPLFFLPDAALALYAQAVGLHTVEGQCPRFVREAHRFKEVFDLLESIAPLSKGQFLEAVLPTMPLRPNYGRERPCRECGQLTTMPICPLCRLRAHQQGEPVPDARGE